MQEKTVDATGRTPVTGALVHFDEGGKHRFVDNDGYDVWRLAAVAPARQESEQDQCSICLDDFDDATFVGTIKECGHKFCVRCVTTHVHKTMVNGHVLCPLCRTAFNPRSVRKARQVV